MKSGPDVGIPFGGIVGDGFFYRLDVYGPNGLPLESNLGRPRESNDAQAVRLLHPLGQEIHHDLLRIKTVVVRVVLGHALGTVEHEDPVRVGAG